jgi:hypothetical protein
MAHAGKDALEGVRAVKPLSSSSSDSASQDFRDSSAFHLKSLPEIRDACSKNSKRMEKEIGSQQSPQIEKTVLLQEDEVSFEKKQDPDPQNQSAENAVRTPKSFVDLSNHLISLIVPFLKLPDLMSFAGLTPDLRKQLSQPRSFFTRIKSDCQSGKLNLFILPYRCLSFVKLMTVEQHRYYFSSSFVDRRQILLNLLHSPHQKSLLKRCAQEASLALNLDKKDRHFLDQSLVGWKNALKELQLPIITDDSFLLKVKEVLPQIVRVGLAFPFNENTKRGKKNQEEELQKIVAIVQKNQIQVSLEISLENKKTSDKDLDQSLGSLFQTSQVSECWTHSSFFLNTDLDWKSVRSLSFKKGELDDLWSILSVLPAKTPNLKRLDLSRLKFNAQNADALIAPPFSGSFQSVSEVISPFIIDLSALDKVFKAFWEAFPRSLKCVQTHVSLLSLDQARFISDRFDDIHLLSLYPTIDYWSNTALIDFMNVFSRHKNLHSLIVHLSDLELASLLSHLSETVHNSVLQLKEKATIHSADHQKQEMVIFPYLEELTLITGTSINDTSTINALFLSLIGLVDVQSLKKIIYFYCESVVLNEHLVLAMLDHSAPHVHIHLKDSFDVYQKLEKIVDDRQSARERIKVGGLSVNDFFQSRHTAFYARKNHPVVQPPLGASC